VPKREHTVHWGDSPVEDVREFTVEDPGRLVAICVESTPSGAGSRASSRAGGFAGCAASPGSARSASTTAGLPGHCALCLGTPTGRTLAASPLSAAPSPCGSEAFWSALALPPIGADDEINPADGRKPDAAVGDLGAAYLSVQAALSFSSSTRPHALVMI